MFDKSTYIQRRQTLRNSVGTGLILFLGNDECGMSYEDNTYPFRQDSSFLYYFGSDYAGLAAIIDIEEERDIIFGNELTLDDIVWMGTQPTISEKSSMVGIHDTRPMSDLKPYLSKAIGSGRTIHFLPPYRAAHKLWIMELLGISPEQQSHRASLSLIKAIVSQRIHKSEEEIREIESAVDISVDMHCTAIRTVRPGIRESVVSAALEEVAYSQCYTLSFPTIATINGQTLHNHRHDNILREGRMFLVDAGAESPMHYAGDLTSTMPVGDRFTDRQELIYNLNVEMFHTAVRALRPGIPYRDIHFMAATTMVEGLKEIGLMKGNTADAVSSGAYAMFFVHGLGHMMGLDVHDMENLGEIHVGYLEGESKDPRFGMKSIRLARPLEPGFCFTVEPGIYFIPELIDKWRAEKMHTDFINYEMLEKWKDLGGIRNEMDFTITADSARRLGSKIKPLTLEEVLNVKNSK